jgi:DNA polymerase III delta subunit
MVRQRRGARLSRDVIGSRAWRPAPVTSLTGAEEFFKRDLGARILHHVAGSERQADTLTTIFPTRAEEIRAALLDLRTPSFFSQQRVVCIKKCESFIKEVQDELLEALTTGLPCGHLILECRRLPAKSVLREPALERDALVDCRRLYDTPPAWKQNAAPHDTELHGWVEQHAARLGLAFTAPLAGELLALTGNAPGVIDAELRKLRERIGPDQRPTTEQILALVPDQRQDSIFHVVDSALLGELKEAHEAVKRLGRLGYSYQGQLVLDQGTLAIITFGAFTSRLRTLRRSQRFVKEHRTPSDLVAAGLVPRPGLSTVTKQLRRLKEEDIERGFDLLLEADRTLKGRYGQADPTLLLETTVIRMANLRQPSRED